MEDFNLIKVSDCCGSDMIPPDHLEQYGSLWRAWACYICRKCKKPCKAMINDSIETKQK